MRSEVCWRCDGIGEKMKTISDGTVVVVQCTACGGDGRLPVDTSRNDIDWMGDHESL